MSEVEYKQGMTVAWSDGEKLVIKNTSGPTHVKTNVDQIFGLGEFDKIHDARYSLDIEVDKHNPFSKRYELVSGYIPQRVIDDLDEDKDEDLVSKYFNKDEDE